MTLYKPNLQVTRMVVHSRGQRVFDEHFHSGLNIIRGENSSGKSTVMDFLFYGLGGDLSSWREAALKCETVTLGVLLNDRPATLSRDISEQGSRPMRIFMGDVEDALLSSTDGWETYPYGRGSKESFSQVLFRLIGLPEVQYGETDTKITMNQILRLLYADQLSPVEKIFRFQRFDDAITRQTVGDLLCGAFSSKFYQARLRSAAANSEFKEVAASIKSLIRSNSYDGHPLTLEWLASEEALYTNELKETNAQIDALEADIFHAQFEDRLTLNDQEETYERVVELQKKLAGVQERIDRVSLNRADSAMFLAALEDKLSQLEQSDTVIEQMKEIEFEVCPSCLAPIEKHEHSGACTLCKTPFRYEDLRSRSLKLINEYSRQREESQQLQTQRTEELEALRLEMAALKSAWEQAERHYRVAVKSPTTELRAKLRSLSRRAGYLVRQLEDLALKHGVVEQLTLLTKRRDDLQSELDQLGGIIQAEQARSAAQVAAARLRIERLVIEFLKRDLSRQSTFLNATDVSFEFDGDRIAVNGDSFFSASSMVYLKNSFLASFLFAAAIDSNFNHPRLLIMDTIEDKGMEPDRSRNFQLLLAEYSRRVGTEHQIIIATSMIAKELNNRDFTVGDFFTHENRTLKTVMA
ncbi:ATP-binding protein [Devosia sp. Leaf64]|uniref:ATP-binding protein n=1 Tax=Devosia sp. Leaf64 TaxID=1736229 RepID=UPI000B17FB21|nr:ATP-binding protein [Devosia sp. Leaf64]